MIVQFIFAFGAAFLFAALLTPRVAFWAEKRGIVDAPTEPRKIQAGPVPLLGGVGVYAAFAATLLIWLVCFPGSFGEHIGIRQIGALLTGGAILLVGGYLDDRYRLAPGKQFLFPLVAVATTIAFGVQLSYINHPFGGAVMLDTFKIAGYPFFGGVFIAAWTLGMIYTTKFLDGMDGLVAGTVGIGSFVIFAVSLLPQVDQSDTALLVIIFAGACAGFLVWNFHPARVFLGEGGSTLTGFILGTLAVISGGKIATALLVMGVPILDAAWVILRRIASDYSPFMADRKHLHFRLLDLGLGQRKTVLLLYVISAVFGVSGIFLQSAGKLVALAILFVVMVILASFVVISYNRKNAKRDQGAE